MLKFIMMMSYILKNVKMIIEKQIAQEIILPYYINDFEKEEE